MNWLGTLAAISTCGLVTAGIFTSLPAKSQSQACVALPVVDGEGTQVQKSVSPPATGITHDNWNTDFFVPSNQSFPRYIAYIESKDSGEYKIEMSLKYNNDTADKVFDRTLKLAEGSSYTIQGASRTNATPYQVNVNVGGLQSIGKAYTVSVSGCY